MTIGPEPMISTLLMSVYAWASFSFAQAGARARHDPALASWIRRTARTGGAGSRGRARLGMVCPRTESAGRSVRCPAGCRRTTSGASHGRWPAASPSSDRESRDLAGDEHPAAPGSMTGMVRAVVAELHLRGRARPSPRPSSWWPGGRCRTSAPRPVVPDDPSIAYVHGSGSPGRSTGRRRRASARARRLRGGLGRHDGDAAAVVGQQAQDVALDAVVDEAPRGAVQGRRRGGSLPRPVRALVPLVGVRRVTTFARSMPFRRRKAARRSSEVGSRGSSPLAIAGLGTLPRGADQRAGVDAGDADGAGPRRELGSDSVARQLENAAAPVRG